MHVVVPKKDGKVLICVDLTKSNSCVKRERHQLLAVEHDWLEPKFFSKLDAN